MQEVSLETILTSTCIRNKLHFLIQRRARFLAFQKPMPPRAVQRSEAELERALWLVNQKKERASELARLMDLEESEGEEALLEPESEQLPRCRCKMI